MARRLAGALLAVPLLFPPLGGTDGPARTQEFLAWCTNHSGACSDRIATIETNLVASADKRFCAPSDGNVTAGIAKVERWLADHPDERDRATDSAIADGWISLYPCAL